MKKLIFLLLFVPSLLMGQSKSKAQFEQANVAFTNASQNLSISRFYFEDGFLNAGTTSKDGLRQHFIIFYKPALPASTSITITISDSPQVTLTDIRDTLCIAWGYSGAANDNAAKLAFLKQYLVNKIVNDYGTAKAQAAAQAATSITSQINIQ